MRYWWLGVFSGSEVYAENYNKEKKGKVNTIAKYFLKGSVLIFKNGTEP